MKNRTIKITTLILLLISITSANILEKITLENGVMSYRNHNIKKIYIREQGVILYTFKSSDILTLTQEDNKLTLITESKFDIVINADMVKRTTVDKNGTLSISL